MKQHNAVCKTQLDNSKRNAFFVRVTARGQRDERMEKENAPHPKVGWSSSRKDTSWAEGEALITDDITARPRSRVASLGQKSTPE